MNRSTIPTVVIIGANRGIGLTLCQHYQALGAHVFAACRQPSEELLALDVEVITDIDVTHPQSHEQLKSSLAHVKIDILINNAGVLLATTLEKIHYDNILYQFEVNAMGLLQVTEALLSHLSSGSKIALISSSMGSMANNSSGSTYGYRMSKAALNAAGVSLAYDLKPRGIAVGILHPGYVKTDMTYPHGDITTEVAAKHIALRIDELNLDNAGTFYHANGEQLPW